MIRIRKRWIFPAGGLFMLALVIAAGCEQTFEPFQENDRYVFSIYGYLDSSADTNWVRVMPVRQTLFPGPEPIDAIVTLEHMSEGGEMATLNDSLFHYGLDAYAWNFWTTMELEPSQTYRLRAARSDGETSSVTVTLPDDFPDPVVEVNIDIFVEYVNVVGVVNLADVHSIHHIRAREAGEIIRTFIHLQDTVKIQLPPKEHQAQINPSEATEYFEFQFEHDPHEVLRREIFVASAGPGWHHFPDIDDEVIALPDGISNVENGVGYLIGIVSKTIPWEMACFDLETVNTYPCPY